MKTPGTSSEPAHVAEQTRSAAIGLSKWFTEEVQPHESQLRSYIRSSFSSVRDVDDVVQESFLRIWRARAARPIDSAKAFLFRIARNLALDVVRHRQATPIDAVGELGELSVIDDKAGVAETVTSAERIAILADALDALPARSREVIILCKLQGTSYSEASARLGISEKTIAEHVYRGSQRLGEELIKRGVHSFER